MPTVPTLGSIPAPHTFRSSFRRYCLIHSVVDPPLGWRGPFDPLVHLYSSTNTCNISTVLWLPRLIDPSNSMKTRLAPVLWMVSITGTRWQALPWREQRAAEKVPARKCFTTGTRTSFRPQIRCESFLVIFSLFGFILFWFAFCFCCLFFAIFLVWFRFGVFLLA